MSEEIYQLKVEKKLTKKKNKKTRRHGRKVQFSTYIFQVLKTMHPQLYISRNAMLILNDFVNDLLARIASEASVLARHCKKRTLDMREIQSAVRLVLPGELAKHAICEATKSVRRYQENCH